MVLLPIADLFTITRFVISTEPERSNVPTGPAGPAGPVGPIEPVGPSAPTGPSDPAGPGGPTKGPTFAQPATPYTELVNVDTHKLVPMI